jgi:hypothetical protein
MLLRRIIRKITLLTFLPIMLMLASWLLSVHGYQRLTSEHLVAELQFTRHADGIHIAHLTLPDSCEEYSFALNGEQWRIDVEFEKARYWANLLGFNSLYRLDRLQGRYKSVAEENLNTMFAYDLTDHNKPVNKIQELIRPVFALMYDASYGSSNYAEIEEGKRYLVYRTPTGLLTRRKELIDATVGQQGITIRINKACGQSNEHWYDIFRKQTHDEDAK